MKHMPSNFFVVATIACILSFACGKQDEKENGAGTRPDSTQLTPFEQLTGEWTGIYRGLNEGKPLGDAISCKMSLSANGEFLIALEDGSQASVDGQWSEFQGKSLILKVFRSSMTRIATSGKVVEPSYDLLGSSLRIGTSEFELKMTRKAQPNNNPGNSDASVYSGNWSCHDGAGRKTKVFIYDGKDFKLSSARQGERAFIAQGVISTSSEDAIKLNPTSTSDALMPGSSFEFRQSALVYELLLHRPSAPTIKFGLCSK